jgi:broad specificity phosphatase PhoE
MTDKDRFEFSYHIMKFTMRNFLKLYNGTNEHYDLSETIDRYFSIFPENANDHTTHIRNLQEMKYSGEFPEWRDTHEEAIRAFLEDFEGQFREYFDNATSVYVMRHAKTKENDGETFLGQRRDPGICDDVEVPTVPDEVGRLYSSPLKRSRQTASAIKSRLGLSELIVDDRLLEIDYGDAEGMTYEDITEEFPVVVDGWSRGQDPRFPDGENTQDVWNRVTEFLEGIDYGDEDTAVVTHNVVMRCILGSQYDIPMSVWHEIVVPHAELFELVIAENENLYINLTEDQVETCFQNVEFKDTR